ncbi:PilZ domain-containing protein [Pseudobacteriovorax antillogorgiicola]|uniref:PilZ domain-containing protein n=1 Tax=Pseudobacteriovorax antillogorgiicola TaxID=1513793 RepID=A0A1Y6C175_9BACT|nr:PilZ domain-containing protein [Pseudobacteriovorax antillogorgiicola]TCS51253.1 PilZ domain-containing protein [Pseudobacteriovorax antillogorgiicola]SMF36487.1 PilZ domain-containing protein [Pseudobacteriovorax antillogorgiicola]
MMASIIQKITDLFRAERREDRYAAYGNFPGKFSNKQGSPFSVMPIDISSRGIGLLIDPAPSVGEILSFSFVASEDMGPLHFRVIHVGRNSIRPVNSLEKMRRCGLEMLPEHSVDLISLMASQDDFMVQE